MQETAEQYIKRILGYVEGQDAVKVQKGTAGRLKKAISGLTPAQLKWRPQPAKWSIAEIIGHLADTEIVASWRMRSVIGENGVTIQPYDQNAWASAFNYQGRDTKPERPSIDLPVSAVNRETWTAPSSARLRQRLGQAEEDGSHSP